MPCGDRPTHRLRAAARGCLERSLRSGPIRPRCPRAMRAMSVPWPTCAKRVGVVTGTVVLSEKDHAVARFKTREELLEGFGAAELDAAFLDADFAAWYLHGHPQLGLRLVTGYTPRERWNMALAVRAKDAQLLMEVNRALAQLAESGELRAIYAEHGVPLRAPFTGSAAQREPPDAWNRIRERGELVVSMDPANLPYSSAKEDQPGFDLELARSLAQRFTSSCASSGSTSAERPRWENSFSIGATLSSGKPSPPTPSPMTRSWRARSCTRGLTTGRAMFSCDARMALASRRSRS